MLGYYFGLALRSLGRNPVLTGLMILAVGVGISASVTMLTIFRAANGDPIPQKSSQLFVAQIDSFGPQPPASAGELDHLPLWLSYTDALALMQAHRAVRQTALYPISLSITPPRPDQDPIQVNGHATYGDFFPMFEVPFEYGGPWGSTEDDAHAPVVVLTRRLNDRLFDGANSVGRTLTIDDHPYRVIGVTDDWRPTPPFYDLSGFGIGAQGYSGADQLFLPFTRAIDQQMPTADNFWCPAQQAPMNGWDDRLHSNCVWITFWAELTTHRAAADYRAFLHNYAAQQRQIGRFRWPPHVALRNVHQWLTYNHIVPSSVSTLTSVSFAILAVCLLNATGLMLAKFMSRGGSLEVRRALGASRPAIFGQCLIEAVIIGLAGAVVGLGLTELGLPGCRAALPADLAILMRMRGSDLSIAIALAVLAAVLTGLYPAWRASRVQSVPQLATRRSRLGAALIALQIAVTLAVLCNALFIIQQRTAQSRAPSGVRDEASVFVVTNRWLGHSADLAARERTDLAALRSLPQVADAIVSYDHPLGGPVETVTITLHPDQPSARTLAMEYDVDDHALGTLGLNLTSGRNFHPDEVVNQNGDWKVGRNLGGVIITQALADQLAPGGHVLGRNAVLGPGGVNTRVPIIGVVAALQSSPFWDPRYAQMSMLVPYLYVNPQAVYTVRAKPGQLAAAMTAVRAKLYQISRRRVITGMQTLTDARRDSYRGDRGLAKIMGTISGILLGITAFGIVGLTSYWVAQRRRQIGIRRAVGATRTAIVRYFQAENLLIAGSGAIAGVVLALATNLWVLQSVALSRLPPVYLLIGVAAMLALGQLAVLWPALRAASVPPAEATRTV